LLLAVVLPGFVLGTTAVWVDNNLVPQLVLLPSAPPAFFEREMRERENAPLEVALVFGRSQGCRNADPALINIVASEAVAAGVPPKILAAVIAVESQCSSIAVSSKCAIGLCQVMPRVWNSQFDFTKVNLFNPRENIHVGASILSPLIRDYGLVRGIQLYNGAGVGCKSCDSGYASKVLALAT
jgi:hypothetical protein